MGKSASSRGPDASAPGAPRERGRSRAADGARRLAPAPASLGRLRSGPLLLQPVPKATAALAGGGGGGGKYTFGGGSIFSRLAAGARTKMRLFAFGRLRGVSRRAATEAAPPCQLAHRNCVLAGRSAPGRYSATSGRLRSLPAQAQAAGNSGLGR